MAILRNSICIISMLSIFMVSALPIPNLADNHLPWAHPCMPNRQPIEVKENYESTDFDNTDLIKKTNAAQILVKSLLNTLKEKILDSEITGSLQKNSVSGFPEVVQSNEQQGISMYMDHFTQLSKAAVFFEQMKYDGDSEADEDLRSDLGNIVMENLQQMCELHLALACQSTQPPNPAPRSIMSPELRNLDNPVDYYLRDYQIMYQYKLLLESHLEHYQQIKE